MATKESAGLSGVAPLASSALADVEKLIQQHFDLFRSEMKEEFDKARGAAAAAGTGAALLAVSGLLGTITVVHLLHSVTRLPLWVCYGLVAGGVGAFGAERLATAFKEAKDLNLVPKETAKQIKKDLQAVTP